MDINLPDDQVHFIEICFLIKFKFPLFISLNLIWKIETIIYKNCSIIYLLGLPLWLSGKESACSAGDL